MASTLREATEIAKPGALAASERIEVAWIGTRPAWLDGEVASAALDGFSVTSTATPKTRVVHLARQAPDTVAEVRSAHPEAAVVVDLGPVASATSDALLDAAHANVALVESELDAEQAGVRVPELLGRVTVAPTPLDLEWYAPEAALTRLPGSYIRRFRRLHRLAHPSILFVGPYTRSGGLDIAIAAAYRLREQLEDVRLAAIPLGAVEQKYLDRCEMEALALGHRGIIEWTRSHEELRLWYSTATVVCCPWREPCEGAEAPVLAAAAARPFLGSDLAVFRQSFRAADAPALVPPGDIDALVDSLSALLADLPRANELGEAARSAVEAVFSYEDAARRLAALWSALAERSPLNEAA
ncbi:MAG: glycosyltransferase [Gemmatimonadota bacterium]